MELDKQRPTILVVDDDTMVLNALRRTLTNSAWKVVTASCGAQALEVLAQQPIALIISDQRMPEMSGLKLLTEVKSSYPEIVRIILTGYTEMEVVVKAINQGEVYRFFTKPWNSAELIATIREVLQQRQSGRALISSYSDQLSRANLETVMALAEAIELKDHYTKGHCSRVRDYSLRMALALNLSKNQCRDLVYASLLHDCGKIGVSENVLNIAGPLTDEQYREVQRHPILGFDMTCKIDYLRPASIIIRQHHERWDGTGYPDRLKAQTISLGARIVAVADTFDAMTSSRPYRRALDFNVAIQELLDNRGQQFDPELVDLFVSLLGSGFDDLGKSGCRLRLLLVGVNSGEIAEFENSLSESRYELIAVNSLDEARTRLDDVDMVICTLQLGDGAGADFLTDCRYARPQVIRIMLIEHADLGGLAETVNRAGLYVFMIHPFRPAELRALVENAFEWRRMATVLQLEE